MLQPHRSHLLFFPSAVADADRRHASTAIFLSHCLLQAHAATTPTPFSLSPEVPRFYTSLNLTYSPSAPSLSDQYLHARPAFLPTHSSPSLSVISLSISLILSLSTLNSIHFKDLMEPYKKIDNACPFHPKILWT